VLTDFEIDERLMAALEPCMDHYGAGDPARYEWPSNVLSVNTVAYESGVIARRGEVIHHAVDPGEFALCRRLSAEMYSFLEGTFVGMKSEADTEWVPFFQVANVGALVPQRLDENVVRARFGGTIMPIDRVVIEPLAEDGTFWRDVQAGDDDAVVERWRQLISFVTSSPELHEGCFVQIGFYVYGETIDFEGEEPPGYEMRGSCLPRLALAFTKRGSVVGVLGHVVWTCVGPSSARFETSARVRRPPRRSRHCCDRRSPGRR